MSIKFDSEDLHTISKFRNKDVLYDCEQNINVSKTNRKVITLILEELNLKNVKDPESFEKILNENRLVVLVTNTTPTPYGVVQRTLRIHEIWLKETGEIRFFLKKGSLQQTLNFEREDITNLGQILYDHETEWHRFVYKGMFVKNKKQEVETKEVDSRSWCVIL
jgi:hypothetical protein